MAKFLLLASAISLLSGCTATPTAFVGVYGEYKDFFPTVVAILEEQGVDAKPLEPSPPVGVDGHVIIHGRSQESAQAAKDIAYRLYEELGEWVTVRPVSITNHSYTPHTLGIYLISRNRVGDVSDDTDLHSTVVPTNLYDAQACDSFQVTLLLEESGSFHLAGLEFSSNGEDSLVDISGTYFQDSNKTVLESDAGSFRYSREAVQHSHNEPIKRTRLTPEEFTTDSVFGCSFLQDLDVIAKAK